MANDTIIANGIACVIMLAVIIVYMDSVSYKRFFQHLSKCLNYYTVEPAKAPDESLRITTKQYSITLTTAGEPDFMKHPM